MPEFEKVLSLFRQALHVTRRERDIRLIKEIKRILNTPIQKGEPDNKHMSDMMTLYRNHSEEVGSEFMREFTSIITPFCGEITRENDGVLFQLLRQQFDVEKDKVKGNLESYLHSIGMERSSMIEHTLSSYYQAHSKYEGRLDVEIGRHNLEINSKTSDNITFESAIENDMINGEFLRMEDMGNGQFRLHYVRENGNPGTIRNSINDMNKMSEAAKDKIKRMKEQIAQTPDGQFQKEQMILNLEYQQIFAVFPQMYIAYYKGEDLSKFFTITKTTKFDARPMIEEVAERTARRFKDEGWTIVRPEVLKSNSAKKRNRRTKARLNDLIPKVVKAYHELYGDGKYNVIDVFKELSEKSKELFGEQLSAGQLRGLYNRKDSYL